MGYENLDFRWFFLIPFWYRIGGHEICVVDMTDKALIRVYMLKIITPKGQITQFCVILNHPVTGYIMVTAFLFALS